MKRQKRIRAVMYARYSSDNQRQESITAQIDAMEKYASQNNITIVDQYTDSAKSGVSDRRPSFQQMIKDSSKGLFDAVLIHKLDRFARNKYDFAVYKQKLKANNVSLLSVTENLDGSPESIILESVLEGMAEYYSQNLAREVMKGLTQNAKQALHTGGVPPLGYDVLDKKLVINEREAESVRLIYSMFADGHTYPEIAYELNLLGFQTKLGNEFGKNSLFEILHNEKYTGTYIYNRCASKGINGARNNHANKSEDDIIRIKGAIPEIVSQELFDKVQAKYSQHHRIRKTSTEKYWLTGMIFCGECGQRMYGNTFTGGRNHCTYHTYKCSNRNRSNVHRSMINARPLEQYIIDELSKNILNPRKANRIIDEIESTWREKHSLEQVKVSELSNELLSVNERMENIITAIENGYESDSLKERLSELAERRDITEQRLSTIIDHKNYPISKVDLLLYINRFNYARQTQANDQLLSILRLFVDRIDVFDNVIQVKFKAVSTSLKYIAIQDIKGIIAKF